MNEYIVIAGPARVPGGCLLRLDVEQRRARSPHLKARNGLHEALAALEFKTGERFGCSLDLARLCGDRLALADDPKRPLSLRPRRGFKPPAEAAAQTVVPLRRRARRARAQTSLGLDG